MARTEPHYEVEQLGPYDYGIWDTVTETWAYEGFQNDTEDEAARLNADGGQS